MTEIQGMVATIYLCLLFFQNERIISLLRDIRENLRNLKKENE